MFKSISLAACIFFACIVRGNAQSTRPDVEKKLTELGITIPKKNPSKGNILSAVRVGNLVYLSGHGPDKPGGGQILGKVGDDLTVEQGKEAAKLCGIALLASLKHEIGDLNKVRRIVKVLGLVNSTATLTQQPQVINGFTVTGDVDRLYAAPKSGSAIQFAAPR